MTAIGFCGWSTIWSTVDYFKWTYCPLVSLPFLFGSPSQIEINKAFYVIIIRIFYVLSLRFLFALVKIITVFPVYRVVTIKFMGR